MIWTNLVLTQHVTHPMFCQLFTCFSVSFQQCKNKNKKIKIGKALKKYLITFIKWILWKSFSEHPAKIIAACSSSSLQNRISLGHISLLNITFMFIGLLWHSWLIGQSIALCAALFTGKANVMVRSWSAFLDIRN